MACGGREVDLQRPFGDVVGERLIGPDCTARCCRHSTARIDRPDLVGVEWLSVQVRHDLERQGLASYTLKLAGPAAMAIALRTWKRLLAAATGERAEEIMRAAGCPPLPPIGEPAEEIAA